ncbi:anticodon nuclease [Bradyrhizobium genosp. SA-3]|uniref:anticodon nuclease n=1 Tax=Bradyrhizobium genosp. SA-3 TaxID=508868 RepID=UPI00102A2CA6|nr:anticodon nuclease [Bradyrhizobium genosp. SA-3]RZN07580.1 anticodon nuclease [Bradyrhizobium genosp. SA-3]
MSNTPNIHQYQNLATLARRLRSDVNDLHCVLLYAYNRTGKTRLSMEFKDQGKRKARGKPDTLYFNAYTEDLFVWHNDLDGDTDRHLKINEKSTFFNGLTELALDESIAGYLSRYADFDFDIDYEKWVVTFRKGDNDRIKISRGEEKIFIWCMFMAICERVIDGHRSYQWVKHLYIDDPISSLDDNNAIAIACDLAALIRKAATRRGTNGERDPLTTIFSSHHALFFNVMCNELGRTKEDQEKVKIKRYFLHRPDAEGVFTLRATGDTPYFHHVATLAELRRCLQTGTLYTYHFNALRSILEKTASFLGHDDLRVCLAGLQDEALYNRALNLLSHGRYAINEPVEMVDDNKELFRKILNDVLDRFQFALPKLVIEVAPQRANS